jgi:hypothetical protein
MAVNSVKFQLPVASFLLLMAATALAAQSPQKIVDDYVKATGGRNALAKIQTLSISGSLRDQATGASGSYSFITKAPNKVYSEVVIEPRHIVAAYNGKSAWGEDAGGTPRTLTGNDAAEWEAAARYFNGRLVDAKKDKIALKFIAIEKVAGRQVYHLELSFGPGTVREVFFDTQTHLIVQETVLEAGGAEEIDYFDYRPTQGVLEPSRIELHGAGHVYEVTVTKVDGNAPVADSTFDFPQAQDRPLPDVGQLLIDVSKNQRAVEELTRKYTCQLTEEEDKTDSNGKVTSRTLKDYDIFYVGEDEVRHQIGEDGKPLQGDEKKKADARFDKDFDEAKSKQAELDSDPKKQEKRDAEDQAQISDFLKAERFTNPRRELFRGQEVIVFDFAANPDYKPKKLSESIAQKLVGVVWVDEQARDVVRLEARFNDNVKIAGGLLASLSKGSNFAFEQTMVNNEVWLPSYVEVHAAARLTFVRMKADITDRYSNYKKFSSQGRVSGAAPGGQPTTP